MKSPRLPQTGSEWGIIAALAVVCTGFGYTLQPVAQSRIDANRASLFCALSPAFAAIFGAILLRERVTALGCVGIVADSGEHSAAASVGVSQKAKSGCARCSLIMDGTLLDTLEDLKDSVNHVLRAHGYCERTLEEVRAFLGNGAEKLMRRALPETVGEEEFAEILLAEYKAWYQANYCVKTRPYEGVLEMLAAPKKAGIQVGIVSNKPEKTTEDAGGEILSRCAGLRPAGRPAAQARAGYGATTRLEKMGGKRESAVYVGDSEVDIQTARNCGMNYIGVSWGFRGREKLLAVSTPRPRWWTERRKFCREKFATCPLTRREKGLIICSNLRKCVDGEEIFRPPQKRGSAAAESVLR